MGSRHNPSSVLRSRIFAQLASGSRHIIRLGWQEGYAADPTASTWRRYRDRLGGGRQSETLADPNWTRSSPLSRTGIRRRTPSVNGAPAMCSIILGDDTKISRSCHLPMLRRPVWGLPPGSTGFRSLTSIAQAEDEANEPSSLAGTTGALARSDAGFVSGCGLWEREDYRSARGDVPTSPEESHADAR